MIVKCLGSFILSAAVAAAPIATSMSVSLVWSAGTAEAASHGKGKSVASGEDRGKGQGQTKSNGKGKGSAKNKDKGKGKGKGKSNAKGQSKDKNKGKGNAFGRSKQEERSMRRANRDGRDDRGRSSAQNAASGNRSLSPSWSKRTPPAPPARMIPLPASTFSRSDLAPDTSPRPQTRSN
jgi:hypothetical protein